VYFFLPCDRKNTPLERTKTTSVLSDVVVDDYDDDDYVAADDSTNIIIIIIMPDQLTWKARFNEVQKAAVLTMHN